MAFQAKRLRVQMPCGEVSVFEGIAPVQQGGPVFVCPHPSVIPTDIFQLICQQTWACAAGTREQQGDPETLTVSPVQLATLRGQLEARMSMVAEAEQAVAAAQISKP